MYTTVHQGVSIAVCDVQPKDSSWVADRPGYFIRLRRIMHDGFSVRAVKAYVSIQEREVIHMIHSFLENPQQWEEEVRRTSSSVMLGALYGWQSVSTINHPDVIAITKVQHTIELASLPGATLIDIFPFLKRLPKRLSKWKQDGDRLYNEFTALFDKLLDGAKQNEKELPDCFGKLLLDRVASADMSHEDAAWLAGAETTSAVLRLVVLNMAMHPDVMRRAQAEIDSIVGRDRMPTMEDRNRLPYVSAVIREVLRCESVGSIPRIARRVRLVTTDVRIQLNSYFASRTKGTKGTSFHEGLLYFQIRSDAEVQFSPVLSPLVKNLNLNVANIA
ncbi:cytochrome P450 [Trametopsis cervina]|nr:cytochrome P450 [Trametopsis cervina]